MKALMIVTVAATAAAFALTPAAAKSKKKHPRVYPQQYGQSYGGYASPNGYAPYGWQSRPVMSDPSLGHPSAADVSRWSGRCVEDLGYGRYEACGW
jgi:hypothetical protein